MKTELFIVSFILHSVFEAESKTFLMSEFHHEHIEQSPVNRILTFSHFLSMLVDFAISVLVTEIRVATSPLEIWWFADNHLAQSIYEKALTPREKTQHSIGC